MKLHLPLSLRSSLLSCMALLAGLVSTAPAFDTTSNLGNTMYVGDSITHGIDVPSWRWAMHKIYVDNGITYTEQGVMTGKSGGGYTNMNYGEVVFRNVHSSESSARAYEISGQKGVNGRGSSSLRFGGTNIMHWLNQENCKENSPNSTHGAGYTIANGTMIDTFFIMIGTNDFLSDSQITKDAGSLDAEGNPVGGLKSVTKNLIGWDHDTQTWTDTGDMDIILSSMRANNANAQVVALTIPTWAAQQRTGNNSFGQTDTLEIQWYNQKLMEWGQRNGVTVVQSDRGMVDMANTEWVGNGVPSMFRSAANDWLHPTVHGDLLIAGNVARQLGYAGRTAGQERKAVSEFEKHVEGITLASGSGAQTYEWSTAPTGGFTAAFSISDGIGNGAEGGWNTTGHFSVSVGNGSFGGTLNINEAYIQWGNTILYSIDTSDTTLTAGGAYANINDTIRIAFVRGNAKLNLQDGFYIWMDDQLIGEGLTFTQTQLNGVSIENRTEGEVTLSDLWMDGTGSWAPSTSRESYGNPLIAPPTIDTNNPYAERTGVKAWPNDLSTDSIGISSCVGNIGAMFVKGGTVTGAANGSNIYGTTGRTSDLYLSLVDVSNTAYNGLVTTGALTGNAYLRMLQGSDEAVSTGAWFASVNGKGATGNLYMEFSADNLTVSGGDFSHANISVAGVYGASSGISGTLTLVFNAGRFEGDIIGGSINGNASVGAVDIYINGGTFTKNIAAGGYSGSVGTRSITITGDDMVFSGTELITAGQADEAHFRRKTGGNTQAPSNNTSTGSATVTIANVTAEGGFGQYTGTLSGGEQTDSGTRSLIFEGTQLTEVQATLQNFDSISLGKSEASGKGSKVGLSSLGGATTINISAGSTLTLLEGIDLGSAPLTISNQGGTVVLETGVNLQVGSTGDQQAASGSYELQSGSSLSMTADSLGGFSILMDSGSSLDLSATTSGLQAIIVVDDTEAAGKAVYNINGLGEGKRLTLSHFTAGSSIVGLGKEEAITLAGKNRLVLVSEENMSAEAALLQGGALGVEKGAELVVDINNIISDMAAGTEASLTYFLSKGGFADAEALKEAMSFDATLVALGWKVEVQGESGSLVFSRATGGDLLGGNILVSSDDKSGPWESDDIYTETAGYDAVVIEDETHIDLRDKDVPDAFKESGLLIKNAMGDASLTVIGDGKSSKVTLSNRLDAAAIEEMEKEGYKVKESLTYSGNITITDAQLRIEHINPEDLSIAEDSATIAEGNVTVKGEGGVEIAGGVLKLQGEGNDFGEGALEFSAGNAGQVVVNGKRGGKLTLRGDVSAEQTDEATREHIRLEEGGELVLADDAAVGAGVLIGDKGGDIMNYAQAAGTLTVAEGADAKLSADAKLQYVALHLEEDSTLTITGGEEELAAPASIRAKAAPAPQQAADPEPPGIIVRGLSGSGKLVSDTQGEEADMIIAVAGEDRIFTGDLSAYTGSMYVAYSPYAQVFSGVTGGTGWNLINHSGLVVFNLMGEDGRAGNALTMGSLALCSGSTTALLMDLATPKRGGLSLTSLEVQGGATVTIGHYDGTVSLAGEEGETHRIALGVISAQEADIAAGVNWRLANVRNAEMLGLEFRNGTLYLVYSVENSNKYDSVATHINSRAGARLLWELGEQMPLTGDLGALDAALLELVNTPQPGNAARANRLLAAAAGASSAVLAQAAGADVDRQLRAMRNRASGLGLLPPGAKEARSSVWLNAESNYHKLDADGYAPGFKLNGWGGTVGMAVEYTSGFSLGLALSAMYNDLTSTGPDRLKGDMDTCYLSGLIRMTDGAWQHTFIATAGTADVDARRTVNYGPGSYTTHLSTDGAAFGLMYELAYSIPLNPTQGSVLQPLVNISWRYSRLDAYSETGSNAALSVAEQSLSSLVLGMGARYQASAGESIWNTAALFELRALAKAHVGDREGEAEVAFSANSLRSASVKSSSSGAFSCELGAGITLPLSTQSAIFADFTADLSSAETNINATLGFKLSF